MKRILFVDHSFHQKTRSSDFFVGILDGRFIVDRFYLSPDEDMDPGLLAAAERADIVMLWQMDFLAPAFLALGKPTIVIPMYDGSAGWPNIHWLYASGARFLNFSLALHERVRLLGIRSMLLRYFPKPVDESKLPRFDKLAGFFWQRRPDHGVDVNYVSRLIGLDLESLHVHLAADISGDFDSAPPADARHAFTTSHWFADPLDYGRQLDKANVFVAPRVAEGIGMALVEAMARGMLVLAHDAPTNNEYISSWANGILFNKSLAPSPIHIHSDARRIAHLAWMTVVEGHRDWLDSHPPILEEIDGTPTPPRLTIDHDAFLNQLWSAYNSSGEEYLHFLQRNISVMVKLSGLPFSRAIALLQRDEPRPARPPVIGSDALDDDTTLDLLRPDDRFIVEGWSNAEPDLRWAVGRSARLRFAAPALQTDRITAFFDAASLPQLGDRLHCAIAINEVVVFDGHLLPNWSRHQFSFDASILRPRNELHLAFENCMSLPGDGRKMAAAFKSFVFDPEY